MTPLTGFLLADLHARDNHEIITRKSADTNKHNLTLLKKPKSIVDHDVKYTSRTNMETPETTQKLVLT